MQKSHLDEAAELASKRYTRQMEQVPCLPVNYANPDHLHSLLGGMIADFPGAAAIEDGRLVGFMCAWLLTDFQGRPAAFSPELANGAALELPGSAADEYSRRIYEELYAHLAAVWVGEGITRHLISFLADDMTAWQTWYWLGFGMLAADGLRPLDGPRISTDAINKELVIRRSSTEDVETIYLLDTALDRYLAESPTFLPHETAHSQEEVCRWLESPENAFWIAWQLDDLQVAQPVAFLWMGPASQEACTIIVDEGTTSILGAYTVDSARSQGIASALLDEGLSWARKQGYVRCAVDFEPMNPLGRRFWLRYFQPVSYTAGRFTG